MTSALAAVFTGAGRPLELRRIPVPVPQGDEVLVRVLGCTVCGSDVHTVEGRRTVLVPTILGHEIVGQIEAFGTSATRKDFAGQSLEIGNRVTWAIVASCGSCFFCVSGLPQKCEKAVKYGHEPLRPGQELTGGLAEYCLLAPGTAIIRVPENLSLDAVCPASCATATIAAALDAAGELTGRTVLVIGAGMLGITACAMSRAFGAAQVVCVDVNSDRLDRTRTFGATRVSTPETLAAIISEVSAGRGIDIVLELSGSPEAFESALPLLRIGGIAVLVGAVFPSRPVSLAMEQVVRRHLTLHGVHNYAPQHLLRAVQFLAEQKSYPFDKLIAEWIPLSSVERVFELAQRGHALRIGVRP